MISKIKKLLNKLFSKSNEQVFDLQKVKLFEYEEKDCSNDSTGSQLMKEYLYDFDQVFYIDKK